MAVCEGNFKENTKLGSYFSMFRRVNSTFSEIIKILVGGVGDLDLMN